MSELTAAQQVEWLTGMLRIRRFEETVVELNLSGAYVGHAHVAIGQEATCVAIADLLTPTDRIADHHRNHGHYLAQGLDPVSALAEILGRANGTNRGRGGSAHLCAPAQGFMWSTAIVGGSIGLAVGLGFALKQAGRDGVAVAYFGDGALEEGIAYESFNLAAVMGLPVFFVCENNSGGAAGIAEFEWPSSTLRVRRLTDVPGSLAIPCETVDGADLPTTRATAAQLLGQVRDGKGPAFLEARTERWPGTRYARTQLATGATALEHAWAPRTITGEHAPWIDQHDPIVRFARDLVRTSVATKEQLLVVDQVVRQEIATARDTALASLPPTLEAARGGVFA